MTYFVYGLTIVSNMDTNTGQTDLSSLFFSKARRAILSLLYGHPEESYYLRQIVRTIGFGLGTVQREVKLLTDAGIIIRRTSGHQVYFQANTASPVFQELKSLITKTVGIGDTLRTALTPLKERIRVAIIYGSVARGEENQRSDIDLLIVGDVTFTEVVKALRSVHDTLGREVNPTVYPVEEFRSRVAEGHYFICNIMENPKIFMIGDENELERLAG